MMNWNDVKKKLTTEKNKERRRIDFVPQQKQQSTSSLPNGTNGMIVSGQEMTTALVNRNKNTKNKAKKTEIYPRDSIIHFGKWNTIRR
jgi:ABC-type Mn2+/Zn2+ transport system ATPase subunit